jgi:hypothetical protein
MSTNAESHRQVREPSRRTDRKVELADVLVEFLRHWDNWVFIGPCVTIAVGLVAFGPRLADLGWFSLGWLLFIPQEYFTHVHILHMRIPRTERGYSWLYRLHYGHHDFPNRHDLMYMPLWLSLPMTLANMALLRLLTPDWLAFLASFCGALTAYIAFEYSHLLCHVPYIPESALWRHVRRRHLLHHFRNEDHWYSVAPLSICMDKLMRSDGKRAHTRRTDTWRYVGLPANHAWIVRARERFAGHSSGDLARSRLWLRQAEAAE